MAAVFIDLCDSSPEPSRQPTPPRPTSTANEAVHFNSDDFDTTINLDDEWDIHPSSKRQKLSPPEMGPAVVKTNTPGARTEHSNGGIPSAFGDNYSGKDSDSDLDIYASRSIQEPIKATAASSSNISRIKERSSSISRHDSGIYLQDEASSGFKDLARMKTLFSRTSSIPKNYVLPSFMTTRFDCNSSSYGQYGSRPTGKRGMSSVSPTRSLGGKSPSKEAGMSVPTRHNTPFKITSDAYQQPPSTLERAIPAKEKLPLAREEPASDPNTTKEASKKLRQVMDSDPIIFTSSPDYTTASKRGRRPEKKDKFPLDVEDDLDDFLPIDEDITDIYKLPTFEAQYSDRTAALLATLDKKSTAKKRGEVRKKRPKFDGTFASLEAITDSSDDEDTDSRTKTSRKSRSKKANPDPAAAEAKARKREEERAQRRKVQEEEKARKQKFKEEKTRAKQAAAAIAEVNKSKMHKKDSIPEMIVDLSSSFQGTDIGIQVDAFLKGQSVEYSFFDCPIRNVVKWRRKVNSNFNEQIGYWEPAPLRIEDEEHILVLLTAKEFVDLVVPDSTSADPNKALDAHVYTLSSTFPNRKPIYLIEGLDIWLRKNKNALNRSYQAAVRAQIPSTTLDDSNANTVALTAHRRKCPTSTTTPSSSQTPIPAKPTKYTNPDLISDSLLRLQIHYNCLIHHTPNPLSTSEWITHFTSHISTIPYRRARINANLAIGFCMETGQVRTGDDANDTFVRMLQEIMRVTPGVAHAVAAEVGGVMGLVKGLREKGPALLENLEKCSNANGGRTDARIGPALARRIARVFLGEDEEATNI
ncbi:MAG: hypothetical protein M1834_001571 [Cirrosporium novae-zelandiae]|nr:MAG: hypothetical protein M1834_004088 [Cirrosporium novae-zelandiae]KAI9735556.1 MAG: hypothetical protein M1834_001571 [Cirrosporium novae-zelandiae]